MHLTSNQENRVRIPNARPILTASIVAMLRSSKPGSGVRFPGGHPVSIGVIKMTSQKSRNGSASEGASEPRRLQNDCGRGQYPERHPDSVLSEVFPLRPSKPMTINCGLEVGRFESSTSCHIQPTKEVMMNTKENQNEEPFQRDHQQTPQGLPVRDES